MKAGSKPVKTMFTYNSMRDSDYDKNNIEISGNTVNYDVTAADEAAFIAENNWSHNWGWNGFHCLTVGGTHGSTGKKILFTDNTIKAPNVSAENKHLMFYSFKSDDNYGNSYLLQNNRLEKFTWVRNQMGVSEFNAALTYSVNIDPTIVRLLTVLLSFFGIGCGILIYIIAAIIMPNEPDIFIE